MRPWYYNPFTWIAGLRAFIIGLAVIIFTTFLAFLAGIRFDGIIDVHFSNSGYIAHIIDLLSIIIVSSILLYATGRIVTATKIRWIDILGTVTLSRIPLVIIPIVMFFVPAEKFIQYINWKYVKQGTEVVLSSFDWTIMIIAVVVTFISCFWYIALLWNGFKVSCNAKGSKAVVGFIIALFLAEVFVKIIINSVPF